MLGPRSYFFTVSSGPHFFIFYTCPHFSLARCARTTPRTARAPSLRAHREPSWEPSITTLLALSRVVWRSAPLGPKAMLRRILVRVLLLAIHLAKLASGEEALLLYYPPRSLHVTVWRLHKLLHFYAFRGMFAEPALLHFYGQKAKLLRNPHPMPRARGAARGAGAGRASR